jgi:Domain of unknown function (DUF3291)
MTSHIAQLNIGRFRYPTDDPRMAAFISNLDRINALAERSEGFVWRLKDESNNATAIRPASDPTMAVNLSVWESVEALERFVWATAHKQFYNRKGSKSLGRRISSCGPCPSDTFPSSTKRWGGLSTCGCTATAITHSDGATWPVSSYG